MCRHKGVTSAWNEGTDKFPSSYKFKVKWYFCKGFWLSIRMTKGEGREPAACLALTDSRKIKGIN